MAAEILGERERLAWNRAGEPPLGHRVCARRIAQRRPWAVRGRRRRPARGRERARPRVRLWRTCFATSSTGTASSSSSPNAGARGWRLCPGGDARGECGRCGGRGSRRRPRERRSLRARRPDARTAAAPARGGLEVLRAVWIPLHDRRRTSVISATTGAKRVVTDGPRDVGRVTSGPRGLHGSRFRLTTPGGVGQRRARPSGLYNVYNATAAAVSLAVGASSAFDAGLGRFSARIRAVRADSAAKSVVLLLIKNPAGANEVVRTSKTGVPPVLVVALNDGIADGRTCRGSGTSTSSPCSSMWASSSRRASARPSSGSGMTYGGLPASGSRSSPSLEGGARSGTRLVEAGTELVVLPTYTAMLALRGVSPTAAPCGRTGRPLVRIRVGHLYPGYLNIYADRGNSRSLTRRAALRGHEVVVEAIGVGDGSTRPHSISSTSAAARIVSKRRSPRSRGARRRDRAAHACGCSRCCGVGGVVGRGYRGRDGSLVGRGPLRPRDGRGRTR